MSKRRSCSRRRPPRDHAAQDVAELGIGAAPERVCVPRLDVRDDLVLEPDLLETALGREYQLGAAVLGIRAALDVAERLQFVDDPADDLLVPSREAGEIGRADSVL